MKFFYLMILSVEFLLFAGVANAASVKEIRVTLEAGHYDQAFLQGTALGTADGFTLAAESLNAKLLLGQAGRKVKTAKQAMKYAEAALELGPKNAEAQFQYALAYGFYGRHVSTFTAWRKNLPKKIGLEIDKTIVMAPNDFRAKALKGAWHLNMLYRADGFDVKKRYGANATKGQAHFQDALKARDKDIIINASYAMLNFVLDPEDQAEPTKLTLETKLLPLKPNNAIERQILEQMQGVYEGFENGKALERAEIFVNQ